MTKLTLDIMRFILRNHKPEMMATECKVAGNFVEDIMYLSSKGITSVEVKESINDLHNEFREKKKKHLIYEENVKQKRSIPNYYCLALSLEIFNQLDSFKKDISDKYGILVYSYDSRNQVCFEYKRLPKKLNDNIGTVLKREIIRRMLQDNIKLLEGKNDLIISS